jgi:hypothetical protein
MPPWRVGNADVHVHVPTPPSGKDAQLEAVESTCAICPIDHPPHLALTSLNRISVETAPAWPLSIRTPCSTRRSIAESAPL